MNRLLIVLSWASLIAIFFMAWWIAVADDLQTIEALESSYQRKQVLLRRLDQLPEKEEQIKRRLADLGNDAASSYLYDGDENRIRSEIQRDLRQIASDAGLQIAQMRPLRAPRPDGVLNSSPLQITFNCSQEQLLQFIAAVENYESLLSITKLNVRIQTPSEEYKAAQLSVLAEVRGFYKSELEVSDG